MLAYYGMYPSLTTLDVGFFFSKFVWHMTAIFRGALEAIKKKKPFSQK